MGLALSYSRTKKPPSAIRAEGGNKTSSEGAGRWIATLLEGTERRCRAVGGDKPLTNLGQGVALPQKSVAAWQGQLWRPSYSLIIPL